MTVYDTTTGEVKCQLMQRGDRDAQRVHSGGVNAVYLTADGRRAVSVSKDATARVWDTSNSMCTLVLQVSRAAWGGVCVCEMCACACVVCVCFPLARIRVVPMFFAMPLPAL